MPDPEAMTIRIRRLADHIANQTPGWPDDLIELWELVSGQSLDQDRPLQEVIEELAVLLSVRFGEDAVKTP